MTKVGGGVKSVMFFIVEEIQENIAGWSSLVARESEN